MAGRWDPGKYNQFKEQRSAPFTDLVALIEPVASPRVIDLGCGTGELTAELHRHLGASETLGIDSSAEMLAAASALHLEGLHFAHADIAGIVFGWRSAIPGAPRPGGGLFDIVFSNAALHWVSDHRALLPGIARGIVPGGQLAVQMPANFDHASHTVAAQCALEEPFTGALSRALEDSPSTDMPDRSAHVLTAREYSCLLDEIGFAQQHVRLQIYGMHLDSTLEVVEWVKGTLLPPYRALLDDDLYSRFVKRYTELLVETEGMHKPYFYAFPRILIWGRTRG